MLELGRKKTVLLVEAEAYEGVRRIAQKVAADIELVTGEKPAVVEEIPASDAQIILCATVGRSSLLAQIFPAGNENFSAARIEGRREVYAIRYGELGGREVLVICGSDKRGTIYGMFALSEFIGVSPLCFWGDAAPMRRRSVLLGQEVECTSKEPSVRYRGFFINDEWPCFGTWAQEHFGDVNAACYDRVFEFLLRMKGNYIWPAMWNSSFPLDGPGSANEELADLYGVIYGYSHHEPCLRASEEWDKVRGENSPYGNAWNYKTNEKGLLRYWEDALIRSGKYENIITIGMRGERDSMMLGEDSTLVDNISLLKRIILNQRALIKKHVPREAVQLLALYKEVEQYFYGDASTPGLKEWEELNDVLFMLCEDNFGHLRTVPPEEQRSHPGGWGMYYHLDYHGGPVSYEWVDSTPLAQIWEQMTQAWEYGIREAWIVNVGDLKLHEVPLSFFMAMAVDYDRWGEKNPSAPQEYTALWAEKNFPRSGAALQKAIAALLTDTIAMNSLRRPEALHAGIYHPCHYSETDRMLEVASGIERRSDEIYAQLTADEKDAYYSMVHYSALASANLVKMHLYAGKNALYASQGKTIANRYATLTEECLAKDEALAAAFARFQGGKWSGMQLAHHIGFTKWNDFDRQNPVISRVTPIHESCMKVARADSEQTFGRQYGAPPVILIDDFLYAGCEKVKLEVTNGGDREFEFTIAPADGRPVPAWLEVRPAKGKVKEEKEVILSCRRDRLPAEAEDCLLHITDGVTTVALNVQGKALPAAALPPMTFLPFKGVTVIDAAHYADKKDTPCASFTQIRDYGKYGSAMKVLPSCFDASSKNELPELTYSFLTEDEGLYFVEVLAAPLNPLQPGKSVSLLLRNEEEQKRVELLNEAFRAGENSDALWCRGVLDQIRSAGTVFHFKAGVNQITVCAPDPGVAIERLIIRQADVQLQEAYLGPTETAHS